MSDAERCRRNGWAVGDLLEADDDKGEVIRIRISAIGVEFVLAVQVGGLGEAMWALDCREWRKVSG